MQSLYSPSIDARADSTALMRTFTSRGRSEVASLTASLIAQGVLDGRGRQALSRCIFYVFIPSLTFTKLGASVDLHNMSRWWILPVNVLIRCLQLP